MAISGLWLDNGTRRLQGEGPPRIKVPMAISCLWLKNGTLHKEIHNALYGKFYRFAVPNGMQGAMHYRIAPRKVFHCTAQCTALWKVLKEIIHKEMCNAPHCTLYYAALFNATQCTKHYCIEPRIALHCAMHNHVQNMIVLHYTLHCAANCKAQRIILKEHL